MKNQKGFTLVEIIVSIALLGIIAVAFLGAMTNQFVLLHKSKKITEDTFSAQKNVEEKIQTVKDDLSANPSMSSDRPVTVTFFYKADGQPVLNGTRDVGVFDRNAAISAGSTTNILQAVIADTRPPDLTTVAITDDTVLFKKSSSVKTTVYATSDILVESNPVADKPAQVKMYKHQWYKTRSGFYIPTVLAPSALEVGTLFPKFPDDYNLIPSETSKTIGSLSAPYSGKHVLHGSLAASNDNKMGTPFYSKSLYISGLPVTTNLKLHLDASIIPFDPLTGSTYLTDGPDRRGKKWNDVAYGITTTDDSSAVQATASKQPLLVTETAGTVLNNLGLEAETWIRYLKFDGTDRMTINSNNSVKLGTMTVYIAVKTNSKPSSVPKTILSKKATGFNRWFIGWTDTDTLGFTTVGNNSSSVITVSAEPDEGLDGKWHILKAVTDTSASVKMNSFQIDDGPVTTAAAITTNITNNDPISIGGEDSAPSIVDIGEILMYSGSLTAAQDASVKQYLKDKFNPTPPDIGIYLLNPESRTVYKDETYTLPATMRANMSNGTVRDVPVEWSPDTADTSAPGVYTFTATSISNTAKHTTLQLYVIEVASYVDIVDSVEQGMPYSLPATAQGVLSTGDVINVPVQWTPATLQTDVTGVFTAIGTNPMVPGKTAHLTLNVVDAKVISIAIVPSTIELERGSNRTLTVEFTPDNAADKGLEWFSDNEDVITVSNGVIHGVGAGTATITAVSHDGSHMSTCQATVIVPVSSIVVAPSSRILKINETVALSATINPSDATRQNIKWTSSNPLVATVDEGTGEVKGISLGTATIYARIDNETAFGTCDVTVYNPVTSITLNKTTTRIVRTGKEQLTATVNGDATDQGVTWTSSNTAVATVSNGLVTAKLAGTVTITATTVGTDAEGNHVSASCTVTVVNTALATGISGTRQVAILVLGRDLVDGATVSISNANNPVITVSGNSIEFSRAPNNFANGTNFTVTITENGISDTIVIRLNRTGTVGNYVYTWAYTN